MRICSEIPLSLCRVPSKGGHDVTLSRVGAAFFKPLGKARFPDRDRRWFFSSRCEDGSLYLYWRDVFEFLVAPDGRTIFCHELRKAEQESFRTYLLGQVLSFAFLFQGIEPLHGTAVVIDGKAIGLVGDCGYGKSSLAAAFVERGFPLLTDDLLILSRRANGYLAFPGPARIKLFPATARRVLTHPPRGTPLNPGTQKQIIRLGKRHAHAKAVPLVAIYSLPSPSESRKTRRIGIRPLLESRAFFTLIRNTFNTVLVDKDRLQRQFQFAEKVARSVRLKQLSYPRSLTLLPQICDLILEDMGGSLHA